MKKGRVLVILLLILISILIIIKLCLKKNDINNSEISKEMSNYEKQREELYGEKSLYSKFNENGERINTSEEMKKEQIIENDVKLKDFEIVFKDNYTSIVANVVNESEEEKGGYFVNLILKNDRGEELVTIKAYLNKLSPKSKGIITTGITADIADAYECEIIKLD